jgi:hypothetical protein
MDADAMAKMGKVRELNAAIDRCVASLAKEPGHNSALNIQSLKRQRDTIMATFPPIRVVHGG